MQSTFMRAHAFVERWEGGFVNHKNDPGGATNRGVSLRWLRAIGADIDGDGDIDIDDIKAVTPEIARDLFHIHFWQAAACDALPPLVAVVVYDGAVNMGVSRAVRQLQEACNRYVGMPLVVDGGMGPRTLGRVNALAPCGDRAKQIELTRSIVNAREEFYRRLASKPPTINAAGQSIDYRAFLGGWLNRTGSLWGWVRQAAREGVC